MHWDLKWPSAPAEPINQIPYQSSQSTNSSVNHAVHLGRREGGVDRVMAVDDVPTVFCPSDSHTDTQRVAQGHLYNVHVLFCTTLAFLGTHASDIWFLWVTKYSCVPDT